MKLGFSTLRGSIFHGFENPLNKENLGSGFGGLKVIGSTIF